MRNPVPDSAWMRRALRLAERGWGHVQPNPLVGAVVLDASGKLVGQGYHARYGEPHAEIMALSQAGLAARGGTLFVSLEPCAHHGQTPPCTEAILRTGIERVVFGAHDVNPAASGGAEHLRSAGVRVDGPIAEAAVRSQNTMFYHIHERQSTFVALKLAATLDGRIAHARGVRTPITGEEANEETQRLRAGFDGIMVGMGTALADDPLLTVRGDVMPRKPPVRIVLDSEARLPRDSRLAQTIALGPVWCFCARDADFTRQAGLATTGVRMVPVSRGFGGLDLSEVLAACWREGVRTLFCEGGAQVAASLAQADRIDRFYLFISPRVLGSGPGMFDALHPGSMPGLGLSVAHAYGDDVLLTYDRQRAPALTATPATGGAGIVHGLG